MITFWKNFVPLYPLNDIATAMNRILKSLMLLLLMSLAPVSVRAEFPKLIKLKGKSIIIPTYNNGCSDFPLVYPKECFYTGNSSKKLRLSETFIGVPITIDDVAIRNEGKKSETLCILFTKDGKSFSVVVAPWKTEKKPEEIELFGALFVGHRPESVVVKCYDADSVRMAENGWIGKTTRRDFIGITQGLTFKRLVFMPGNRHSKIREPYVWDSLQAEFGDEVKNVTFGILTFGSEKGIVGNQRAYTFKEIDNVFKE